jgi:hypothetical protein
MIVCSFTSGSINRAHLSCSWWRRNFLSMYTHIHAGSKGKLGISQKKGSLALIFFWESYSTTHTLTTRTHTHPYEYTYANPTPISTSEGLSTGRSGDSRSHQWRLAVDGNVAYHLTHNAGKAWKIQEGASTRVRTLVGIVPLDCLPLDYKWLGASWRTHTMHWSALAWPATDGPIYVWCSVLASADQQPLLIMHACCCTI